MHLCATLPQRAGGTVETREPAKGSVHRAAETAGPARRVCGRVDRRAGRRVDEVGTDVATLDLAILDGLAERPLQEHAEVYDQVHVQLQEALREIDDA